MFKDCSGSGSGESGTGIPPVIDAGSLSNHGQGGRATKGFVAKARETCKSPQPDWKNFSEAKNGSLFTPFVSQLPLTPLSPPHTVSDQSAGRSAIDIAGLVSHANEPARLPALSMSKWFAEEVHPHDSSLKGFLRNSFPAVRDVEDVVQESYLRIWKVRAVEPVRSAKAFLFTIAQHVALDFLRRERRSPIQAVANLSGLEVVEDRPAVVDGIGRNEKIQILIKAIDALPGRCREVVILRKLKLIPQREVAELLGISEKGVENQLARGLERCRSYLRKRGVTDFFAP